MIHCTYECSNDLSFVFSFSVWPPLIECGHGSIAPTYILPPQMHHWDITVHGAWAPSIKLGDIFKLMQTATPWTHVPGLLCRRQEGMHTHNWPHALTALSATCPRQRYGYDRFETSKVPNISRCVPTLVGGWYRSWADRPQGLMFAMQKCCIQFVHMSIETADPIIYETKSSSILIINL